MLETHSHFGPSWPQIHYNLIMFLDMADKTPKKTKTRLWTTKERSWCVRRYFECKSFAKTRIDFMQTFNVTEAPTKSAIFKMAKKFEAEGTVKNLYSKSEDRETHCGRKTIRTPEVVALVRESVEKSPKRSSRRRCQFVPIS